jgi:outer membrane protein TolC
MVKRGCLALAVATTLASMYGCAPTPPPFDPHQLQAYTRRAANENQYVMQPLSETLDRTYSPLTRDGERLPMTRPATGASLSEDTPLPMTLQEIVQRAVNNSLEIRVAGYDPAINSNRVIEAEAAFDPILFFNPSYERRNQMNAGVQPSIFSPAYYENYSEAWRVGGGVKQDLQSGGQAALQYTTTHNYGNPAGTIINPYFENELRFELTQPLLRNFGSEVNTARITISRNDQRISILDFRSKVEETLFTIEQTYWQLVAAMDSVRIQEELLNQTIGTAELLVNRGVADVTRVQTSQANQAIQSRRAQLLRLKAQVRDLSDRLKQLMNDPTIPVSDPRLIIPASAPVSTPLRFDLKDLIDSALEHRLELAQQALRVDSESVRSRVSQNNLLPRLDLQGAVGAQGVGSRFGSAANAQDDFDHMSYTLGLQFEIPIGNRSARAIHQRIQLGRLQAISRYRQIIDQVALEVKTALRNVRTSWEEMTATRQARLAAADTLEAIVLRERNNEPLTPTFVQLKLDTQARVAEAARAESESIANYNIAVAQLERAKGTLLRYDNVLLEEDRQVLQARYQAEVTAAPRNAAGE